MKMLKWLHSVYGGVKLQTIETTKQTPALLAASMGQFQMLQWMDRKQFPLIDVDSCGMTIVHHAVLSGRIDIVKWLVLKLQAKYPFVVNGTDNNGMTPRWLAKGNQMHAIADWIGKTLARWEGTSSLKSQSS